MSTHDFDLTNDDRARLSEIVYPLDMGESWRALEVSSPELHNSAGPSNLRMLESLAADLRDSATQASRLWRNAHAYRVVQLVRRQRVGQLEGRIAYAQRALERIEAEHHRRERRYSATTDEFEKAVARLRAMEDARRSIGHLQVAPHQLPTTRAALAEGASQDQFARLLDDLQQNVPQEVWRGFVAPWAQQHEWVDPATLRVAVTKRLGATLDRELASARGQFEIWRERLLFRNGPRWLAHEQADAALERLGASLQSETRSAIADVIGEQIREIEESRQRALARRSKATKRLQATTAERNGSRRELDAAREELDAYNERIQPTMDRAARFSEHMHLAYLAQREAQLNLVADSDGIHRVLHAVDLLETLKTYDTLRERSPA